MDTNRDRRNMQVLNRKELKRLPINLRKKAIREARNMAGMQKQIPQRQRRPRAQQNDFERAEHNAMLHATNQKLQEILANFTELNDISYDCTPAELRGKVRWTKALFVVKTMLCGEFVAAFIRLRLEPLSKTDRDSFYSAWTPIGFSCHSISADCRFRHNPFVLVTYCREKVLIGLSRTTDCYASQPINITVNRQFSYCSLYFIITDSSRRGTWHNYICATWWSQHTSNCGE